VRISASEADVERWAATPPAPSRVVPKTCAGGRTMGVLVSDIGATSTADEIGLRSGDVITAVNGKPLDRPEAVADGYDAALRARMAVLEVVRDRQSIVIAITW